MNMIEAVRSCFLNYATFKGRASRAEFWYFILAIYLVKFLVVNLHILIFREGIFDVFYGYNVLDLLTRLFKFYSYLLTSNEIIGHMFFMPMFDNFHPMSFNPQIPLIVIFQLLLVIPTLAVSSRRLHDSGRKGWWLLLIFTFFGILFLLYLLALEGDKEENEYGLPFSAST